MTAFNKDDVLPDNVKRAYDAFEHQKQRCYNKNHMSYKWYGDKGITVDYCTREFIGWFLSKIDSFKGIPTVGRIDHSKSYCIENIELQTQSEQSKEQSSRNGPIGPISTRKPVLIFDKKSGILLRRVESVTAASIMTGAQISQISGICLKRPGCKSAKGFTFKFELSVKP